MLFIQITSRQQQTQRTLLDCLRVAYAIEKPSGAGKEEGKMQKAMATAAGGQALRGQYTRTIEPARAIAAEALALERTLSGLADAAQRE
jgi:hypothetical protein